MEINKPLQDWEMSCLAERMSPMEFDQIARGDLGITKIRLDQVREDAGRNCITYMANSLTAWRDLQPQNEARQLLYSALTKAADRGLIERKSFMFLITGEEDERYEESPNTQWDFCLKQMQAAKLVCRSCPTPFLVVLAAMSFVCTLFLFKGGVSSLMYAPTDQVTQRFMDDDAIDEYTDCMPFVYWFICLEVLSPTLIVWSIGFECCLCFNVRYVRGHRARERKRDLCRFKFFAAMIFLVYAPTAFFCFARYKQLKTFLPPENDIAKSLDETSTRTWDKIQIWFDCCGIRNYTYWHGRYHGWDKRYDNDVPDSCCKEYKPGCGNFTSTDQINEVGCLPYLTGHITEQMRHRSLNNQLFALMSGVTVLLSCVLILHWARKEYYGDFVCCKIKPNIVERNNDEVVVINNNGDENVEDEVIVNIADNDVNEDNNGNINTVVEDNIIIHEDAVNSDEENLL